MPTGLCAYPQVMCTRKHYALPPHLPIGFLRDYAVLIRKYLEAGDLHFAESVAHMMVSAAGGSTQSPMSLLIAQMLLGEVLLAKERPHAAHQIFLGATQLIEQNQADFGVLYNDALYGLALSLYDKGDINNFVDIVQLHWTQPANDCMCMSVTQREMLAALRHLAWRELPQAMLKFSSIEGMRVQTGYYRLAAMLGKAQTFILHQQPEGALAILKEAEDLVGKGWGRGPFVAWKHRFPLTYEFAIDHGMQWPEYSVPLSYLGTISQPVRRQAKVEISAFGAGHMEVSHHSIKWDGRPMTKIIMAYLAMNPKGVTKEQMISALWPEQENDDALHSALKVVRTQVGADVILYSNGLYRIASDFWFDVTAYEQLYVAARELPLEDRLEKYREAISLYDGPFLHGVTGNLWVQEQRVRLSGMQAWLQWTIGAMYYHTGQFIPALHFLDKALDINPIFDPAVADKARLMEKMDQRTEAIVMLVNYRQRIEAHLGTIGLSRTLQHIYDQLTGNDPLTAPFVSKAHILRPSQLPMRGLPPQIDTSDPQGTKPVLRISGPEASGA